MLIKAFLTVFITVFLAELGDKTQLATLLFASNQTVNKWLVFAAAASALVLACGIGVLAGGAITRFVSEKQLSVIAGVGFVLIGIWTLFKE